MQQEINRISSLPDDFQTCVNGLQMSIDFFENCGWHHFAHNGNPSSNEWSAMQQSWLSGLCFYWPEGRVFLLLCDEKWNLGWFGCVICGWKCWRWEWMKVQAHAQWIQWMTSLVLPLFSDVISITNSHVTFNILQRILKCLNPRIKICKLYGVAKEQVEVLGALVLWGGWTSHTEHHFLSEQSWITRITNW